MSGYLGDFPDLHTGVIVFFNTFDSNDPSASVIVSDFIVGDVAVYKDGGTTQRTSTNGFTLLDTDGINFDGLTGVHGVKIDLSDDTDTDFFVAGAEYSVIIGPVTVDGAAITFEAASFSIERAGGALALLKGSNSLALIKTSTDRLTAVRAAVLTDWINGGRLDLLLDAIPTTMVGTDNAFLASVGGALADAAAAGEVTTADTLVQYIKQLINILIGNPGIVTFKAEAAPANGVSLSEVIRAIHVDTSTGVAVADGGITSSTFGAGAIDAASLSADAGAELADAHLNRNMATGTDSGSSAVRTPRDAFRSLRNRVDLSENTLTVFEEDDTTEAWRASLTTTGDSNFPTAMDPSG